MIYAEGVLLDVEDGTELARAQATFVGAPEARKQELKERYGFRLEAEDEAGRTPEPQRPPRWTEARPPEPPDDRRDCAEPGASPTTELARAFVADHMDEATALGRDAGELVGDPVGAREPTSATGLARLADPAYLEGQRPRRPGHRADPRRPPAAPPRDDARAPGGDARRPQLDRARRRGPPAPRRAARAPLDRVRPPGADDPRGAGALLAARARAPPAAPTSWITVDSLAHVTARGILAETYRWAELEQLVYSPSRWERRLVGSTIAMIPSTDRTAGRTPEVARRGLALVRDLIGDAEPDVQKALSWALRSLSVVDPAATVAFLRAEAATRPARRTTAIAPGSSATASRSSRRPSRTSSGRPLDGIRKRPNAPTTSRAAETAAAFIGLGVDVPARGAPDRRPPLTT